MEQAIKQQEKAPQKCKNYVPVEYTKSNKKQKTKETATVENNTKEKEKTTVSNTEQTQDNENPNEHQKKIKKQKIEQRKIFSKEERQQIYRKTKGHCYICGEFVDYDIYEIEHKIPLSKGGTNNLSNLFCSCHSCNVMKQNLYIKDFTQNISRIISYQKRKKYKKKVFLFLYKLLEK